MTTVPGFWPVDCLWSVVLPKNLPIGLLFIGLRVNGVLFVVAVVVAWAQMPRLSPGPHVSGYF